MKAIDVNGQRGEGKVDLNDTSRELAYRARMRGVYRKLVRCPLEMAWWTAREENRASSCDSTYEVLAQWPEEELRSSAFVPPPDESPLNRRGSEELDSDSEGRGEAEDGVDEARNIFRDVKIRKYASGGGESVWRVKFSTTVNRNGGTGVREASSRARINSLITVWNTRATDSRPWRV